MTLIDLGELRDDPLPDPGARPLRRQTRLLGVAGALVLALATLAAAGPPPVPLPQTIVPARLASRMHIAGDLLIVTDAPTATDAVARISAYQLPAARLRWRITLPVSGEVGRVSSAGDILLLSGGTGPGAPWTNAVDAADGRPLWQGRGWPYWGFGGGQLIFGESDESAGTETLRVVDPRTGSPRWSMSVPQDGGYVNFLRRQGAVEELVNIELSGRITTYRADSGQRLGVRQLPPPGTGQAYRLISLIEGLFLAVDTGGTVTAYGYPGLDRRWSLRVDGSGVFYPAPCGRYACVYNAANSDMQLLDLTTGRVTVFDRRWQLLVTVGDYQLASAASPLWTSAQPVAVVDPVTGRMLRELGRWRLVGAAGIDVYDSTGPVIGVRIDQVTRRMTIAELDPTQTRARILGVVHDVSGECVTGSGVLVCRRMDASFGVWQLGR